MPWMVSTTGWLRVGTGAVISSVSIDDSARISSLPVHEAVEGRCHRRQQRRGDERHDDEDEEEVGLPAQKVKHLPLLYLLDSRSEKAGRQLGDAEREPPEPH